MLKCIVVNSCSYQKATKLGAIAHDEVTYNDKHRNISESMFK